jgi:hypothetical protein
MCNVENVRPADDQTDDYSTAFSKMHKQDRDYKVLLALEGTSSCKKSDIKLGLTQCYKSMHETPFMGQLSVEVGWQCQPPTPGSYNSIGYIGALKTAV